MTITNQLTDMQSFIDYVTTILVHTLWQGMLIGFLAAAALSLLRNSSARIRYVVSCSAMTAVILAAFVTAAAVWPDASSSTQYASAATDQQAAGDNAARAGATVGTSAPVKEQSSSHPWWTNPSISRYIFALWITGVIMFTVYHLLGWRRARAFTRRGTFRVSPEWQARFEALRDEFGVKRLVSLLSSSLVKVPCVVGWIKPVVLVPVSMFTLLDPSEIEMILMHELAHVRRYDILINMIQTAMETLLFFNPAIWWISRQIRIEREHCCDDTAVYRTGNRLKYARALANLEELRMSQTSFGTAIAGTPLKRRIERIVGVAKSRFYSSVLSFSGLLLIASVTAVLLGSSGGLKSSIVQASPRIDVTSAYSPQPGDLHGNWEVESDRDKVKILVYGRRSSGMSLDFFLNEAASLIGKGESSFSVKYDAGTLFLKGTMERHGRQVEGDGEWYFRADSGYLSFMSRYGLRAEDRNEVFSFAIHDISREYISRMEECGYRNLDLNQLLSARIQDITPEYVKEFRKLGYTDIPFDRLLSMRIQGVTADDAREFERLGCGHLTPDELISARIHDITPAFVRGFREASFHDLSYKSFVTLRAFNLDVRDLEKCYQHRFMDMSEDNLVWVCGFGITKNEIKKMQKRGYTDLDTIISILAKDHGR